MAKKVTAKTQDSFDKHLGNQVTEIDLENAQWEQVSEDKPQYHKFEKENPVICKFLQDDYEVGDFKAFLILNLKTGQQELLPDQMRIREAFEEAEDGDIFRIEFKDRVKIKNSKREFVVYDVKKKTN